MSVKADDFVAADLAGKLRQMIAVLQEERQALATLQPAALIEVTSVKEGLCDALANYGAGSVDPESRALLETAKALNDVNRRVRNLLAANVAGRLDMLSANGQGQHAYTANVAG